MAKIEGIGHIRTGFAEKFGVPRQSRLADTKGYITLEGEYANPDTLRGIEEFSHIWLIWGFSEAADKGWSPTVRPPRLGGNVRKGVFATRSPFRPNSLGLSCVKLESVEYGDDGPVLCVSGVDMVDGTPIYDIKPYVPYADSIPDAKGSFAQEPPAEKEVVFEPVAEAALVENFGGEMLSLIRQILAQDPRPSYQEDPDRVYGMSYGGAEVRFKASGDVITVIDATRA